MHDKSDVQLIALAREGKREAFGILFERYLAMAQRVARRIVHDRMVAEELAQDAMLEAYLSLDKLKDPTRYASWLYGIVRNVCHSYLRRQANSGMRIGEGLDSWRVVTLCDLPSSDPVMLFEQKSYQDAIQHAIQRLPAKRQKAAALFYLEQLSIREIAQRLNTSETAIKSRLFQARKQLQIQLAPFLGDDNTRTTHKVGIQVPTTTKRKETMLKIDAIHAFGPGDDKHAILCFLNKESPSCLKMWVGLDMAQTLNHILEGKETARPLTHNTMAQLIDLLDAKVTHVEVCALKETTFYGIIHIESHGEAKQLDARPSDAVTLALVTAAPIYVADDLMEKIDTDLQNPFDEERWLETIKSKFRVQNERIARWQEALSADRAAFTVHAHLVCTSMMAEAERYGHGYVGTEHLLMGLLRVKEGVGAKALEEVGVTYSDIETLIEEMVPRGTETAHTDLSIVPRVAAVLELAEAERVKMGHVNIGTEHILLGLLAEDQREESDQKGMAMQFLAKLGADGNEVRQKILTIIANE